MSKKPMHNTMRNKNIRVFKLISSIILIFGISFCLYIFNQYQRIEDDQLTRINNSHAQRLALASERLSSVIEEVDDMIKKSPLAHKWGFLPKRPVQEITPH
ncbi:hypothetical protein L2735_11145 [Shewanella olleyana]|uniref:hypothetical protein n=1 Tax=Shewanella olleyana TaxID=135626 RepID=UPI00200E440F|nr:hypothetical protein [Shewanella olleyana]MCL1067361.1 hypothetical protein [Shewanella olleyana]